MSSGCATTASARVQSSGRGSSGGGLSMAPSMPSKPLARQSGVGLAVRHAADLGDRRPRRLRSPGVLGRRAGRRASRSPSPGAALVRRAGDAPRSEPLSPSPPAGRPRAGQGRRDRRPRVGSRRQRAPRRARDLGARRPTPAGRRACSLRRCLGHDSRPTAGRPSWARLMCPTAWLPRRRRRSPSRRLWACAVRTSRTTSCSSSRRLPGASLRRRGGRSSTWGARCPDELVPAYCRMRTQMNNDVPRGELDYVPVVFDEERLRVSEERIAPRLRPGRGRCPA